MAADPGKILDWEFPENMGGYSFKIETDVIFWSRAPIST